MIVLILAVALALQGCLASNLAQVVRELGKDKNQNCVIITTIYGTVTMLRTSPDASFKAATGSCGTESKPQLEVEEIRRLLSTTTRPNGGGTITVPIVVPPMTLIPAP